MNASFVCKKYIWFRVESTYNMSYSKHSKVIVYVFYYLQFIFNCQRVHRGVIGYIHILRISYRNEKEIQI